jgi:hypothetical protein
MDDFEQFETSFDSVIDSYYTEGEVSGTDDINGRVIHLHNGNLDEDDILDLVTQSTEDDDDYEDDEYEIDHNGYLPPEDEDDEIPFIDMAIAALKTPEPMAFIPPQPIPTTGGSKMDRAKAVYNRMAGAARKDVIAAFVSEVGLTPAGAGTYYQQIKSKNK